VYIAALIKTPQQSGNSSGKVAFNPSIFSQVYRCLKHLLMKWFFEKIGRPETLLSLSGQ